MWEGDSLSLASNFITCGFKDSKNRLWFGGDFLCMGYPDEGKFTNFKYTDGDTTSISAQYVNEIVEDEGGRVWMATRNGLCVFNESTKTFTRFLQDTLGNKGNAFERNFITDLAADKHGALWVATLHGLYRFSIESKEFSPIHLISIAHHWQILKSIHCVLIKVEIYGLQLPIQDCFYLMVKRVLLKKLIICVMETT